MKVFESALVLSACLAVVNCQQDTPNWTNPYRSPATFEPERYGEYSPESYYESYTHRLPHGSSFDHKFPHGADYPPTATFHHWGDPARNENLVFKPKEKKSDPKPKTAEKQDAKKQESEQPAKPAEHKAEGSDAAPKDGYLVAHRPQPGSHKPTLSRSKDFKPVEEVQHF